MKKQINKINFIYILSFLGDALFSPFLALYFSSLDINESKKGLLLALIPLATLIGSLIYGKFSNKMKRNLLIIRILVIMQLIAMSIMGFITSYYLIAVFVVIFALHNNTFFSFQDGIAVKITNKENKIYANTRLFGTLGYFIGSVVGGKLIDLTSFGIVFLIAGIIYAIVELMFFLIKPFEEDENEEDKEKITFKNVLSNRQYIFYLMFYILVLGTWHIEEAYVSIMFKNNGLTTSMWGYVYAFQILIEMGVIYLVNKFLKDKHKHHLILMVAICAIILRSVVLSLSLGLWIQVILVSSLRGVAWGLFLSSHMETIKSILPKDLITKAILIFAISSNIFVTIGNYLAPYIYQKITFNGMFLVLLIIQIIGASIYLITFNIKYLRKKK
ncbi:MAG: MFS transporter [Erysipelotrichaceae bacterium]|nr:MFS transporter [Erysipelotrichaceae bacterium]